MISDARRWWVVVVTGIATFMSALDVTVTNMVLPVIRSSLHAGIDTVQWVVTIYQLVISGMVLCGGRLGDQRGHKDIFLVGLVGFTISSVICAIAPTIAWLIAARGMQAAFGAVSFANAPALLTNAFPERERGRAFGLMAMMTYLGLSLGPSVGGPLAQWLGWRWVFCINVPVGMFAVVISMRFIPNDRVRDRTIPFDWLGAGLFIVGLLALMLALNQGHTWGWRGPATLTLVVAFPVALAAFLWVESSTRYPMLDLSLFRRRSFSSATLAAVLNYICTHSILFLLPFYLVQARGLGTATAGLLFSALPLSMMVTVPVFGALSDRVGTRGPSVGGLGLLGVGLWLLSRLDIASPRWHVIAALVVCGIGTGSFIAPNSSRLMGAAPQSRRGIAAGVLATARHLGMVLGAGLAGAILTTATGAAPSADTIVRGVTVGFLVASGIALLGAIVCLYGDERARSSDNLRTEEGR